MQETSTEINEALPENPSVETPTAQETVADTASNPGTQDAANADLAAQVAEMRDKWLRLNAEFDNFRRRTAKERVDLVATASEKLMVELLPVLDDMERARKSLHDSQDIAAIKEGLELVFGKFAKVLERQGLKAMEHADGVFDADLHEAITQIPVPDDAQKGRIVDVIEKGYYLHEKPIRYAKVVLGA